MLLEDKRELLELLTAAEHSNSDADMVTCPMCHSKRPEHYRRCLLDAWMKRLKAEIAEEETDIEDLKKAELIRRGLFFTIP